MEWSFANVVKVTLLFFLAGLCEIGGGWLVWQAVRCDKPAGYAIMGSIILIVYGFIPTLQPLESFGRLYAVYGGLFIGLAYLWGAIVDKDIPDKGDIIGSVIAFVGVCISLFWPRGNEDDDDNFSSDAARQLTAPTVLEI